jgi:hypothetical protein
MIGPWSVRARTCAHWCRAALLCLSCIVGVPGAGAQSIESALSPGRVVKSHAEVEGECAKCHVRFDPAAQDRLCLDCHKDVAGDLRQKAGLHGRQKAQPCRDCHTDHRGREMRIAEFDRKAFDHKLTDYRLDGKHAAAACKSCHGAGKKYREAAADCLACHLKDDRHKGTLGKACADCHDARGWKGTVFDHAKTRFPLAGKHVDARCEACHKSSVYNEAPKTCLGCHRKDDKHKARYGEKCESCHNARNWTSITFHHDTDTRYLLRGRHRETRCDNCHTGHLYRDKLGSGCIDCHRKDDKHKGTLGLECVACHSERDWKETGRFDHDQSRFALRGGHLKPACKDCHATALYKETPSDCVSCHRKDDKHAGTLGGACADCHSDRDWKASRFDHARTRFALQEGHAVPPLDCKACHTGLRGYRPTALECFSCHRKDDKHEAQLGARCESCHGVGRWRGARYDHARARFVLTGAHVRVECKACHASPRYRDAARDCIGCHRKDDKHLARLGEKCESCHNARDWRLWSYDHERRADYRLDSGHARVACESCHRQPAPAGKAAAPLSRACMSCHSRDDVHDGSFGARCEACHTATRWKSLSRRPGLSARPTPMRLGGGATHSRGRLA